MQFRPGARPIASLALLIVALVAVVGLAKVECRHDRGRRRQRRAPHSFVGVVIAVLVLLPETLAAVRNARRDQVQISLNLALGSAIASIGLTIPAIAVASIWLEGPLLLGLGATQIVLLTLTAGVGVLTVMPGRATLLQAARPPVRLRRVPVPRRQPVASAAGLPWPPPSPAIDRSRRAQGAGRGPVLGWRAGPTTLFCKPAGEPRMVHLMIEPVRLPSPWCDEPLTVVVPTYNEAGNLPRLVERLFALPLPGLSILVADDNSPDGTGEVAEKLAAEHPGRIRVVHRAGKEGLGRAYVDGIGRALEDGAKFVAQMDADLSHPPEALPGMLGALLSTRPAWSSGHVTCPAGSSTSSGRCTGGR